MSNWRKSGQTEQDDRRRRSRWEEWIDSKKYRTIAGPRGEVAELAECMKAHSMFANDVRVPSLRKATERHCHDLEPTVHTSGPNVAPYHHSKCVSFCWPFQSTAQKSKNMYSRFATYRYISLTRLISGISQCLYVEKEKWAWELKSNVGDEVLLPHQPSLPVTPIRHSVCCRNHSRKLEGPCRSPRQGPSFQHNLAILGLKLLLVPSRNNAP